MKEKYPKSWEVLKKYVKETYLVEMLKAGGNEVEIPSEVVDKTIENMFAVNNVLLFPFFDEQKIYLTVKRINNGFMWNIYESESSQEVYHNRQQAEIQGFDKAYEILESSLS